MIKVLHSGCFCFSRCPFVLMDGLFCPPSTKARFRGERRNQFECGMRSAECETESRNRSKLKKQRSEVRSQRAEGIRQRVEDRLRGRLPAFARSCGTAGE